MGRRENTHHFPNQKIESQDIFLVALPLIPRPGERLMLWEKMLPPAVSLSRDVDLKQIAGRFELSGADILNVVHYCCLEAMAQERAELSQATLMEGIQRELRKLGKGN